MFEALRKRIAALPDGEEKKALEAELAALEAAQDKSPKPEPKPEPKPAPASGSDDTLKALQSDVTALKNMLTESAAKQAEAEKRLAEQVKKEQATKIETLVADAIKSGKIAAGEKDKYIARLSKDFEEWSSHLTELPGATPPPGSNQKRGTPPPAGAKAATEGATPKIDIDTLRQNASSEIAAFLQN